MNKKFPNVHTTLLIKFVQNFYNIVPICGISPALCDISSTHTLVIDMCANGAMSFFSAHTDGIRMFFRFMRDSSIVVYAVSFSLSYSFMPQQRMDARQGKLIKFIERFPSEYCVNFGIFNVTRRVCVAHGVWLMFRGNLRIGSVVMQTSNEWPYIEWYSYWIQMIFIIRSLYLLRQQKKRNRLVALHTAFSERSVKIGFSLIFHLYLCVCVYYNNTQVNWIFVQFCKLSTITNTRSSNLCDNNNNNNRILCIIFDYVHFGLKVMNGKQSISFSFGVFRLISPLWDSFLVCIFGCWHFIIDIRKHLLLQLSTICFLFFIVPNSRKKLK